jgi:NAD(P)-dependent dehydrogenase (short-subunit alcohol dehydrogenase family)
MTTKQKTIIVTGASQGIGAAVANLFLERGYNVVGNSRKISQKNELQPSEKLALVDGDIGLASTAEMIVGTAVKRFGSVDALGRFLMPCRNVQRMERESGSMVCKDDRSQFIM